MNNKYIDYAIGYLVVVFSGLNYFMNQNWTRVVFFLLLLFVFRKQKKTIDPILVILVFINLLIIAAQSFLFGGSIFTTITFLISSVIIPYLSLKVLGIQYVKYVVNVIFVYAIISLLFWSLTNISPSFHDSLRDIAASLGTDPIDVTNPLAGDPEQFILYTYEREDVNLSILRNPGPFHEPGAFAVFLIFAICFNTIINDNKKRLRNIVLVAALLTTFSTSGYLALMAFVLYYAFFIKVNPIFKFIISSGLIVGSVFLYLNAGFMSDKINYQIETGTNISDNYAVSGRFMGAVFALRTLEKYPLTGQGIFQKMRKGVVSYYGFMDYASRIGIPAIILFFIVFFISIKRICIYHNYDTRISIFVFGALLSVLFAQVHIVNPLFQMLFMTALIYPQKSIYQSKNIVLVKSPSK